MPIDKRSGPGGVSASYGARSTKTIYKTDRVYDDLITDSEGNIYAGGKQISSDKDKVIPSQPWSAAEAVVVTDIRRLPTGERIICTAAGTTGATAPVLIYGAAPAAITDNTATWWLLEVYANSFVENSGTSALTPSHFHNNPERFFYGSARNRYTPGGSGLTTQSRLWAITDGSTGDNGFGANGNIGKYVTREFDTDADIMDIGFFSATAGQPHERFQVLVDGKEVFATPYKPSTNGSSRHLRIRLGKGRGDKNVVVTCFGALILQYVAVPSDCYVRYPANPGEVIGVFTDSFGDTESPAVVDSYNDFTPTLGRALGYKHILMAGVGGTSYSLDASGRKNLRDLLALNDIRAYNLDAIVIGQGYNAGQATANAATEATYAKASWTALRASAPGAPMVIIGSWYKNPTATAGHVAVEAALKAAFLEQKDPNSVFIDPFDGSITTGRGYVVKGATGPWFSDAVSSWAIGADAAHPSPAGRVYLTEKATSEVKFAFASIGKK